MSEINDAILSPLSGVLGHRSTQQPHRGLNVPINLNIPPPLINHPPSIKPLSEGLAGRVRGMEVRRWRAAFWSTFRLLRSDAPLTKTNWTREARWPWERPTTLTSNRASPREVASDIHTHQNTFSMANRSHAYWSLFHANYLRSHYNNETHSTPVWSEGLEIIVRAEVRTPTRTTMNVFNYTYTDYEQPQIGYGSWRGTCWIIHSGMQRDSPQLIMIVCTRYFDMYDVCLYKNLTKGDRLWVESSDLPIKGWIGVYSCCVYVGSETGCDYRAEAVVYSIFFHLRLTNHLSLPPFLSLSVPFNVLSSTPLLLSQQLSFNLLKSSENAYFFLSFVRIW